MKALKSITGFKCPTCLKGDLYPTRILSFKGWFKMYERCPVCGQKYVLEPGFYWGAMYISYAVCSGLIFVLFAVFYWGAGLNESLAFILAMILLFFIYPFVFRIARAIWLNIYVKR